MYKNLIYHPFLLCIVILGLAIGCGGKNKEHRDAKARKEAGAGKPGVPLASRGREPGDGTGEGEEGPDPNLAPSVDAGGVAVATSRLSEPLQPGSEPPSGLRSYPTEPSDRSSDSFVVEDKGRFGPNLAASADAESVSEAISRLSKVSKSAVIKQAAIFTIQWKKIGGILDNTPPAIKELFPRGKPALGKRGEKFWKITKESVQEEGGNLSAATGELGQAVKQVESLVGAATALAILDPKKLSEEDLKVHFVEKLGGSGVDLATIPEEVKGAISVVRTILRKHIEVGRAPSDDMSEEAKNTLQANGQKTEKMVAYLDLLEWFIAGTLTERADV